jgi:hypothetical protein
MRCGPARQRCRPWAWAEDALRENTALFAHGVGLLLIQHTGRIRMFGQDATLLFDAYLICLVERLQRNSG